MSPLQNDFEWQQFLKIAEELHDSVEEVNSQLAEAKYRTVVGRAYYAAFNIAKHYLESTGVPFSNNGKAHVEVRDYLSRIGGKAASAARNLNTLRNMRGRADYELNPSRGKIKWCNESTQAIKLAKKVSEAIDCLR